MKLLLTLTTILLATNLQARLNLDDLKEMKKRSLAVFLVPESPQFVERGTCEDNLNVSSFIYNMNEFLKVIPSIWSLTSEVKIFEAGAINSIPDADRSKWTILTLGTNSLPVDKSVNISGPAYCRFGITLTLADKKNLDLYKILVADLSMTLPESVSTNTAITSNELTVVVKLIESYITDCVESGYVGTIEDFGNKRERKNCEKLAGSTIILPEILRNPYLNQEKYDKLKQVKFVSNNEFDDKLANPSSGEFFVFSVAGGSVSGAFVTVQFIIDVETYEIMSCFRGNSNLMNPSWLRRALKC